MMDYRSIETKAIISLGLKNINNPFFYYMAEKNEFSINKMGGINYMSIAFYVTPFINAIVRSGTMEEKDLVFKSFLEMYAFEKIESGKRGHKGELVPRVEEAVRIATNVKARQTKLQDQSMALLESRIRDNNLQNADKKDSQEICFIDDEVGYAKYISDLGYKAKPGKFVDKDGKVLGEHKGIINYTIGQRKGLGIAIGKPAFVTKIDAKNNQVVIGDNADLFTTEVVCSDYSFAAEDARNYDGKTIMAKVRYSAQLTEATLKVDDKNITATFEVPQRAATPGQSIVFYEDEKVIGGGFIE